MTQFLVEIEVPIDSCELHPYTVSPHTTSERIQELTDLERTGSALPYPIIVTKAQGFFVIFGWDILQVLAESGNVRMKAYLLQEPTGSIPYWCITKQSEAAGLNWTCKARSIHSLILSLKKEGEKSDHATLSEQLKINRSTITRYVNIVTKLNPRLFTLAESGHLTYSDCRKLIQLAPSEQEAVAQLALTKHLTGGALMKKAFPKVIRREETTQVVSSLPKTTDTKRMETTISEIVGYPVSINTDGTTGNIEYQFFDRLGLVDLLSKLRKGFSASSIPKGKIVLHFESLDEFENIAGGFFAED